MQKINNKVSPKADANEKRIVKKNPQNLSTQDRRLQREQRKKEQARKKRRYTVLLAVFFSLEVIITLLPWIQIKNMDFVGILGTISCIVACWLTFLGTFIGESNNDIEDKGADLLLLALFALPFCILFISIEKNKELGENLTFLLLLGSILSMFHGACLAHKKDNLKLKEIIK